MPQNYVPAFLFIAVVGILIPLTLVIASIIRTQSPNRTKLMPYECGIDPYDNARGRYTVRYYIIAILFVVFDVETIFLFPWAVKFKSLGRFRPDRDAGISWHPDRRLHLDLEERRPRVGVTTGPDSTGTARLGKGTTFSRAN